MTVMATITNTSFTPNDRSPNNTQIKNAVRGWSDVPLICYPMANYYYLSVSEIAPKNTTRLENNLPSNKQQVGMVITMITIIRYWKIERCTEKFDNTCTCRPTLCTLICHVGLLAVVRLTITTVTPHYLQELMTFHKPNTRSVLRITLTGKSRFHLI